METTFKYNGKIITTPNLEKKLKRMKISIDDIEIIDNPIKKKKLPEGIEDYMLNKKQMIVRSTQDDIRRIVYVDNNSIPTIFELFKNQIWNPETKTGIKYLTKDFLMTMYYETLCLLYETSIKMLECIEQLSSDMLDEQEYLNWKDELNRLSIDVDR